EAAAAAGALERVLGVGQAVQLGQDEAGHDEGARQEVGLHDVGDAADDDDDGGAQGAAHDGEQVDLGDQVLDQDDQQADAHADADAGEVGGDLREVDDGGTGDDDAEAEQPGIHNDSVRIMGRAYEGMRQFYEIPTGGVRRLRRKRRPPPRAGRRRR